MSQKRSHKQMVKRAAQRMINRWEGNADWRFVRGPNHFVSTKTPGAARLFATNNADHRYYDWWLGNNRSDPRKRFVVTRGAGMIPPFVQAANML